MNGDDDGWLREYIYYCGGKGLGFFLVLVWVVVRLVVRDCLKI
jgi:hypothetical protein